MVGAEARAALPTKLPCATSQTQIQSRRICVMWENGGLARPHHRARGTATQPEEYRRLDSAQYPYRHHGVERIGEIVAGLRHDLCRRPAPLRRNALALRAPVSGSDGATRGRFDRWPQPRDFDRAEDHQSQSAVDSRDHHRNLRLPARAVCRPSGFRTARIADIAISRQTPEQILEQVLALRTNERVMILAPIVRGRKGEYKKELEKFSTAGFFAGAHRRRDALARRRNHA